MFREPSGYVGGEREEEESDGRQQWVEGRVAMNISIWKSRFLLSLQQSAKANVSMRRDHA